MTKASNRGKKIFGDVVAYTVLIIGCLGILLPFFVILSTSFKTYIDSVKVPFRFFRGYIDFAGYKEVLQMKALYTGIGNTLIVVLPIMFIGVFTSLLSAFAFAKMRFRAKGVMFTVLMFSMMIPGVITMTPAYVVYDWIGWTDSFLPLMIPNAFGTAACTFFLRQYFYTIPNEMLEAAEIDGLGKFGTFIRIMIPLAKPAIIAQMVLWFIAGYNDYFGPMLYLNTESKYTLQLVLRLMTGSAESNWPKIMACCIITMIPMLVLYFVAQKQLIEGISSTGLKD